jgi:hypothetical protein
MRIEDQVVSVELAKEMEELGIKQDSIWIWVKGVNDKYGLVLEWDVDLRNETYSAFTVAELGEMLPGRMKTSDSGWNYLHTTKLENTNEWLVAYFKDELKGSSEADAHAKMLLYLLKEKIIKVGEVGK